MSNDIERKIADIVKRSKVKAGFYLVLEKTNKLKKISSLHADSQSLSSFRDLIDGTSCRLISVVMDTLNGKAARIRTIETYHIELDENMGFDLLNSKYSSTSNYHLKELIKMAFRDSKYAYISSDVAISSCLVRRLTTDSIDDFIDNDFTESEAKPVYESLILKDEDNEDPLKSILEQYNLHQREIERGITIRPDVIDDLERALSCSGILVSNSQKG